MSGLVTSDDALADMVFSLDGADLGQGVLDAGSGEHRLPAVLPGAGGSVQLEARAVDAVGQVSAPATHQVVLVPDEDPTGSLSTDPAADILPNHLLRIDVSAEDDQELVAVHLSLSGEVSETATLPLQGLTDQAEHLVRVPAGAAAGSAILVEGEVEDSIGQRSTLPSASLTVLADTTAPDVGVVAPAPDSVVTAGDSVAWEIDLADEVRVDTVELTIDGAAVPLDLSNVTEPGTVWTATATATWVAPEVAVPESLDYTVTAVDPAGNAASASGTIDVEPLISPYAPRPAILCPAPGDPIAPGVPVQVAIEIVDDDDTVQRYELQANGIEVASAGGLSQSSVQTTIGWTPSASLLPGELVELRLIAEDYAGNIGLAEISLEVSSGTLIRSADVPTLDSSFDGLHLTLAEGRFALLEPIHLAGLDVLQGAMLGPFSRDPVHVETTGEVRIACGGIVTSTCRGYVAGETYPGADLPGWDSGGSHMGQGGVVGLPAGETYGSVARPYEEGSGGNGGSRSLAGAGIVRLTGADVLLNGNVQANGCPRDDSAYSEVAGAGGSVWITGTGSITGRGTVEARGGEPWYAWQASGGGGAIALEAPMVGVELNAPFADQGGPYNVASATSDAIGGSGTVLVRDAGAPLGHLLVDNDGLDGAWTVLPALGSGTVSTAVYDGRVDTGRAEPVPGFFVGHRVEVVPPAGSGEEPQLLRVAAVDDAVLVLEDESGQPAVLEAGSTWQGLYLLDSVTVRNGGRLRSEDPIRCGDAVLDDVELDSAGSLVASGTVEVLGAVTARSIEAGALTIRSGATLSHPATDTPDDPRSLRLDVTGALTIEPGGAIDVSGRGYRARDVYPGSTSPGVNAGGSHIGQGGAYDNPAGSAFGSIHRPLENGGGGDNSNNQPGRRGGGAVRVEADSIVLGDATSAIRANGEPVVSGYYNRGGAGGSIWLIARSITGDGAIEAHGGDSSNDRGSGGGGAIAVEYETAAGTWIDTVEARGGTARYRGGAGSVYLRGPGSVHGDLLIDNLGLDGAWTVLPALGGDIAGTASGGAILDTGRASIQGYLVGHWVRVQDALGQLRGRWRVASIDGGLLTLETNAEHGAPDVQPGDRWDGLYRLDSLLVTGRAKVSSADPLEAGSVQVDSGCSLVLPSEVDTGAVRMSASDGTFWITGGDGTVGAPASVGSARLVNLETAAEVAVSIGPAGGFPATAMPGASGETVALELTLADGSGTALAELGTLPANLEAPVLDLGLVAFQVAADESIHLVGQAGAVSDASPPLAVEVRNDTTAQTWELTAAGDGSFDTIVATGFADTFSVRATDGHPEPLLSEAVLADAAPPELDGPDLAEAIHDRAYWISGQAGAVLDDLGAARVWLRNPDQGLAGEATIAAADGSFDELTVPALVGESLELVATDVAGNQSTLALVGVPANDGPPVIDPSWILTSAASGTYDVSFDESCWTSSQAPLASADGLWLVQLENRTTPVLGPDEMSLVGQSGLPGLYGFDPAQATGAVGDEIWLVAADDHPEPQVAEVSLWTLPAPPDAPVVGLGPDELVIDGIDYRLMIPAGAITDDNGPLSLWLEVWHPDGATWTRVLTSTATLSSGDSHDMLLNGGLVAGGDLVLLWVTDTDGGGEAPRTTVVRVGELPLVGATVRLDTYELRVSEGDGQAVVSVGVDPAPQSLVSVDYRTSDGTAVAQQDYLPAIGTLYFDPETFSHTITVDLVDDQLVTGERDLTLSLTDPSGLTLGEPSFVRIVILEDDGAPPGKSGSARAGGPGAAAAGQSMIHRTQGETP